MRIKLSENSFLFLRLSAGFTVFSALFLILDHIGVLDLIDSIADWWGTKILFYIYLAYLLISMLVKGRKRKNASERDSRSNENKTRKITLWKLTFDVVSTEARLTTGRHLLVIVVLLGWGAFAFWVSSLVDGTSYMLPVAALSVSLPLSVITNYFDLKWGQ